MNLEDKRKEWERGGEVILVVTDKEYIGHKVTSPVFSDTVYVIIDFGGENYSLHRYFMFADHSRWEVTADRRNSSLEECLAELTKDFESRYPKEDL